MNTVLKSIDKCHLLQYTTRRYDNAGYLEFRGGDGIEIFLPQPAPNEFTFTLGIYDEDVFGGAEKIAILMAQHFTLLPTTNQWTSIPLVRDTHQYYNNIHVNVRMQLSCLKNYYGNHCQVYCKPEPSRYTCNSDGSFNCIPGLIGVNCDKEDSCYYEPCADHATCVNKDNESGRICVCGGEERPECYPDYNPCQSNPCQNGGECHLSGQYNKSFTCQCTEQWTGHRCTERRSACLEEALKLQHYENQSTGYDANSTDLPSVCLNGGTCFEHPIKFEVRCVCSPEWTGDRCELSVEVESLKINWILLTLITVGIVLFIIVVLLTVGFVWKYMRRKRAVEFNDKHGAIVYYHNPRNSTQSNYGSSCPLNPHFMNSTYEDTSNNPPIIVKPSNAVYSKKLEPSPLIDEYDECDPLGIYAGAEIYATAFPPDDIKAEEEEHGGDIGKTDEKDKRISVTETIVDPFDEDAPPLPPLRPTTFDASPYQLLNECTQLIDKNQRPQSPSTLSTFTNNFNDTTPYHQPSSLQSEQLPNVSIINSSTFDNNDNDNNNSDKPAIYQRTSSISNV
ncbi:unnamed protein product [Trichobilharzia szidati]|nr:unnamed protein product [Trichobilharzia szidati]